jgi:hypothetical protein
MATRGSRSFNRVSGAVLVFGTIGMGILLLGVGVYHAVTVTDHWQQWPKAQAIVAENRIRTVRSRNGPITTAEPVFRFTVAGRTVEAVSRSGRSPPEFSPGEAVSIAYNPVDPSQVTQQIDVYEDAKTAIGVGTGMTLFGVLLRYLLRWLSADRG